MLLLKALQGLFLPGTFLALVQLNSRTRGPAAAEQFANSLALNGPPREE